MKLTRESLLARSLRRQEITVADGTVTVRELSAAEVSEYVRKHKDASDDELSQLAWIVVRAVCDDAGKPLFTDADIEAVRGMSLATVKGIAEAVARLSGLSDDDAKKNKPTANSETTPAADSLSA